MKVTQQILTRSTERVHPVEMTGQSGLVLVFGSNQRLSNTEEIREIASAFPGIPIVGCSTAGEVSRDGILQDSITLTVMDFAHTTVRVISVEAGPMEASATAGARLGRALAGPQLQYVLVLSDGLQVNGAELVKGLLVTLPQDTIVSGGLAGDGARFSSTLLVEGSNILTRHVLGVGFYSSHLTARCMSVSGWKPFGMKRTVTRSKANVVYELDNTQALEIYSSYLGEEAENLPASGLLYPLEVETKGKDEGIIRTLLAVDRDKGTLTFAGDVPEGATVRLMHGDYSSLVKGAELAGQLVASGDPGTLPKVALLFSCVGRKLMMGSYTDLEIDAVARQLPSDTVLSGFYTYGEIGYYAGSEKCELHNQTMTVTTLFEE